MPNPLELTSWSTKDKPSLVFSKILVTGGAGFIGANFLNASVRRLPDCHFVNVDALTYAGNLASLADVAGAKNYSFERVDIADPEAVKALFEKHQPDLVVHFAAESHVDRSILGPEAFLRTNVQGTFNLLEACRQQAKPALFHHVSTDEVYGSLGDDGLFTEDSRYDPSSPYSATKAASDHLVRAYHRTYQLPVRISNCSNNYGPYQFPEKLIPLMIMNAMERKPLPVYGDGSNVRDWLFVDDHVEGIWAIIEQGKNGETYNVGGNNEVKNLDLVQTLCRVVAEESKLPPEDLLGLITFVKDRPGHDQRYAIDASKVARECHWAPKETLETGLRRTVRWYMNNSTWTAQILSGEYKHWIDENYGKR